MRYRLCVAAGLALTAVAAADWRQFRGNDVDGVSSDARPPAELNAETLAWNAALPGRGLSSPIVVGERVFISACSGPTQDRLHVLCFSDADGTLLWERQFWATGRTVTHDKTCVAAPTPCSDGERVFATYSSNDVICLDLDGQLQWCRGLTWDFPNASNSLGMSSSPVVVGGALVTMVENDDDSFTVGLNAETGETEWKIARPRKANWTSPVVYRGTEAGLDRVLLQSAEGVVAVNPKDGTIDWTYADGASTIPSSVVDGEVAYVPSHGITAIRPGRSNPDTPEILWQEGALSPATGSPVAHDGKLYLVNSAGALTCASQKDGKRQWQVRLKGPISSSLVVADNRAYLVSEEGLLQSVDLRGEKGELLSAHPLKETVLCTPALSGNAIYLRSDGHLWKFVNDAR
ncbi:MAG: PQQ-binding-like beta-propeller repeat protein [Planctomycetaceae bacterium]